MSPGNAVRQERAVRRREQLLTAAMQILSEEGVSALTHRAVAGRAGLPSSSTGYYFPTIRELVDATVDAYTQRGIAEVGAAASVAFTPDMTDDQVLDALAKALIDLPMGLQRSILDLYLEASRKPELRPLAARISEQLVWVADRILDLIGVREKGNTARTMWVCVLGSLVTRLGHPAPETDVLGLRAELAVVMADALRSRSA